MKPIGELKKLKLSEIRKIWPHEEKDLSPWIAKNIEALNNALNLQIEIENAEEYIYNFRLDLAGTDNYSQMPVLIENQFGKSNHDHLGKLITYSGVKEAGIIIWISNEIQIAHRNAIEWLNKISPQEMTFYGVELEVFTIDNSLPAPNFRIVAGPPPSKRRTMSNGEISPRYKLYQKFFSKLRKKVLSLNPNISRAQALPRSYWSIPAGRSGFSIAACFVMESKFRVELYIDTGKKEYNDFIFENLEERKSSIEKGIENELVWELLPEKRASRISIYTDGTIDDDNDELDKIIEWAVPYIIKFREVFEPLLKTIEFDN